MKRELVAAMVMAFGASALASIDRAAANPVVFGDYYEDTGGMGVCGLSDTCVPSFNDFPASTIGKVIILTEVACDLSMFSSTSSTTNYLTRVYIEVSDSGTNPRRRHALTATGKSGPHSFSLPMTLKMSGGPPRRPLLTLKSNTTVGWGGVCNVVGRIANP